MDKWEGRKTCRSQSEVDLNPPRKKKIPNPRAFFDFGSGRIQTQYMGRTRRMKFVKTLKAALKRNNMDVSMQVPSATISQTLRTGMHCKADAIG